MKTIVFLLSMILSLSVYADDSGAAGELLGGGPAKEKPKKTPIYLPEDPINDPADAGPLLMNGDEQGDVVIEHDGELILISLSTLASALDVISKTDITITPEGVFTATAITTSAILLLKKHKL